MVVGPGDHLLSGGLVARGLRWIAGEPPAGTFKASVRIRYRHPGVEAEVLVNTDESMHVHFAEPQRAVAPGQAVVLYQGSRVLGGGWIEASTSAEGSVIG